MLGGKKNSVDLVADFHSTSSNMGFTFIVSRLNPFVCRLVAWLYNKYQSPYFHIYYTPEDQDSSPFFDSLGKSGLTVEIGPIPHGTTPHADVYKSARQLAVDVMEFSVGWNDGIHTPEQMIEVPVYKKVQDVLHLKDASGALVTQVDPDRLGKDYQPINKGDSMLVQLGTGERIPYEGDRTAYPVFINETAKTYYGKAMQLAWLSMEKW
jgi:succinylglutamate desuccinylase